MRDVLDRDANTRAEAVQWCADLMTEVRRLRLLCRIAADQLEASYMHLPRDQYPGPPETIIARLRTAEPKNRS